MNSLASEDDYKFKNTPFFLKHYLWHSAGSILQSQWHCKLQPEPRYNLPIFPKITKKVWRNWFCLLKEEKKINPVLKHCLWDFGRRSAYWADPDLDTLIFGSWPCQSQTRAPWLWIKLFDSSAHRHTKPALSQLLHKSLWNPRMVFVNSAAMRTVPTCQMLMWPHVIRRRESINKLGRKTSLFFGPKNEHMPVKELSLRVIISLICSFPSPLSTPPPKKLNGGRTGEMTNPYCIPFLL